MVQAQYLHLLVVKGIHLCFEDDHRVHALKEAVLSCISAAVCYVCPGLLFRGGRLTKRSTGRVALGRFTLYHLAGFITQFRECS